VNDCIADIAPGSITIFLPKHFTVRFLADGTCERQFERPDVTLYEVAEFFWKAIAAGATGRIVEGDVSIAFEQNKIAVVMTPDGHLTVCEGYTPDEFTRSLWVTIAAKRPQPTQAEVVR